MLLAADHQVTVVDDLSRGQAAALDPRARFVPLKLSATEPLQQLLTEQRIEGVLHFAALAVVGESHVEPLLYYQNNVADSVSLLAAVRAARVPRLVYSSTCAVYGIPDELPLRETAPLRPISPYGRTKQFVEMILHDFAAAAPHFGAVALRYFNVAGCAADGSLGEDHRPETHLIPILLQAALGQREKVIVQGTDYPTADGTCIRDYLHVEDLCAAHLLALQACRPGHVQTYNLGIGRGYSVLEVIRACERVLGQKLPLEFGPRRPGDPPALFADATNIRAALGWVPRYQEIEPILETAWRWFGAHPRGYDSSNA